MVTAIRTSWFFLILIMIIYVVLTPRAGAEGRFGEWSTPSHSALRSDDETKSQRFRSLEDEDGQEVTYRPTQEIGRSENSSPAYDHLPASEPGRFLASAREKQEAKAPAPELGQQYAAYDTKGIQEYAVVSKDNGFFPKAVVVTRNIPVRLFITRASGSSGCFMMNAFNVKKQIKQGAVEEVEFTPKKSGVYRFFCPATQSDGALIVRDAVSMDKDNS